MQGDGIGFQSQTDVELSNFSIINFRRNIKKKRHIFPEILLEYLRENNFEKFGVKWCKHQSKFAVLLFDKLGQNPSATLDCVQVDWDILLGVHKTVKNRQNLVKSFTNWKFIRVVEAPVEIWFCNQLDSSKERSLFRPDNPQVILMSLILNYERLQNWSKLRTKMELH